MTRPGPGDSVTDEKGARFYPIDGDQYWSVTTALSIIAKEGLHWWSAGLVADYTFTELPKIVAASITKPCGNTFNRCRQGKGDNGHDWRITCPTCPCRLCQACIRETMRRLHIQKRDERADEGIRVHDWIEHWVLTNGTHAPVHEDIAPYIRAFLAFVKFYGLTPNSWLFTEATVINRAARCAGTTDGGIRFEAKATDGAAQLVARIHQVPLSQVVADDMFADLIFDTKTKTALAEGKSVKVEPTVSLQLAGYRWSPIIRFKTTGEERPMPELHGALALLLYPDMAVPRLCVSDEQTYDAFIHALELYRWHVEHGSASVAEKSFPLPPEPTDPRRGRLVGVTEDGGEAVVKPMGRAPRKAAVAAPAAKKTPAKKAAAAAPVETVTPNATLASIQAASGPADGLFPNRNDEIPF